MIWLCGSSFFSEFDFSNLMDVILGLLTLFLTFYIFVIQKRYDSLNTKFEWFKNLVIQPKLQDIYTFYDNIYAIKIRLNNQNIDDTAKIETIRVIKQEYQRLRKSFVGMLELTAPTLHSKTLENLDSLIDGITEVIDDDSLDFSDAETYSKHIDSKIELSYNSLFSLIYNHKVEK